MRIIKGLFKWIIQILILCIVLFCVYIGYLWFFPPDFSSLAKENPKFTALMKLRIEQARKKGRNAHPQCIFVPIGAISQNLIDAVLISEDFNFFYHKGYDIYEIKESIKKNIEKRRFVRGGSTITQQLVKNLYLSPSKNPFRKLAELVWAIKLERVLSKRRILELYLNYIELGDMIFGVESASRKYFNHSAAELTFEESVQLAAVIPRPLKWYPGCQSKGYLRRVAIIREKLVKYKPAKYY